MKLKNTIMIGCGGTGGHIYPGIAIAEELILLDSNINIIFIGSENNLEEKIINKQGYQLITLPNLKIKKTSNIILYLYKCLKSFIKSIYIINKFKPKIIIGLGGYSSFMIVFSSFFFKKMKIYIYEANAIPGLANKILSFNVNKIFGGYKNLLRYNFKKKLLLTGNPVRKNIIQIIDKKKALNFFNFTNKKNTIFFVGGSVGADNINNFIEKHMHLFKKYNLQIIGQIGFNKNNYLIKKSNLYNSIKLYNFIENINYAYNAADIIISRAGAGAISELCIIGKPTILIPSPNVRNNHQYYNALEIEKNNAAIIVKDINIDIELMDIIINLINDTDKCKILSNNIKNMSCNNAAKDIASILINN
ncbi:MAG: undecaprenyldiphospho-muramoylpentapeptide beta-N-acetylglucosaminyltransferase [Bacteroides sp.]|nr:MAG: undecaprenyldiphospho-muramoylpentapeptide beta-N-acetylglucosaminyltransferase [Bacteroides sp.]